MRCGQDDLPLVFIGTFDRAKSGMLVRALSLGLVLLFEGTTPEFPLAVNSAACGSGRGNNGVLGLASPDRISSVRG